jgi:putative transposase
MPRQPRNQLGLNFFHCINRGVGKRVIFHDDYDYRIFLFLMARSLKKFPVDIVAFCLMPNHWHMVIGAEANAMSKFFNSLLNAHTRRYHRRYETIGQGPIYQGRYKSIPLFEDGVIPCARYVERNPLTANLVKDAGDWRWSSFRYWDAENSELEFVLKRPFVETRESWAALVQAALTADEIAKIKK